MPITGAVASLRLTACSMRQSRKQQRADEGAGFQVERTGDAGAAQFHGTQPAASGGSVPRSAAPQQVRPGPSGDAAACCLEPDRRPSASPARRSTSVPVTTAASSLRSASLSFCAAGGVVSGGHRSVAPGGCSAAARRAGLAVSLAMEGSAMWSMVVAQRAALAMDMPNRSHRARMSPPVASTSW